MTENGRVDHSGRGRHGVLAVDGNHGAGWEIRATRGDQLLGRSVLTGRLRHAVMLPIAPAARRHGGFRIRKEDRNRHVAGKNQEQRYGNGF
jgi:hypothetical protein